jgi:type IV pilus assembly protein PilV
MRPLQYVNSNKEAGFTLVEFSIATFIMMVGLLGLLQGVNIAIEHNLGTLLRNEAVSVADEQLVEAKNAAAITSGGPTSGFDNLVASTYPVSRKINSINYTYVINRLVTAKSVKSKEVQINVTWTYRKKTFNHQASSLVMSQF